MGDQTNDFWRNIATYGPIAHCHAETGSAADYERLRHFRRYYSFAVPSEAAVAAIKDFVEGRRLLEAGAGSGLWARLLSDAGVAVTAMDNGSWHINTGWYHPVWRVDSVKAVAARRDCEALMLCWPVYHTKMASKTLAAFRGDRLVYVGEGPGGCTGDDRLHEMLANWRLERAAWIPRWPGLHDRVAMYERR